MISIVIPTYNNSNQLMTTISSVLSQNVDDIEIIVIDDASTDDTELSIKKMNNSKIKYFKQPQNMGATSSRIAGIKKSSGKYVGFLDDDDVWFNDKLKKQMNVMTKKNLDFVMCNYIINDMVDNVKYEKSLKNLISMNLIHVDYSTGELPLYIEILTDHRKNLMEYLKKNNIETRVLPPALITAPQLKQNGKFPNSISFGKRGMYLPSGPDQNSNDIDKVFSCLKKFDKLITKK